MSNKTSGDLPYLTEALEFYLMDREESKRYRSPFKASLQQIEKCWEDLKQSEASWDIRDLIASGKQFPYPFLVQREDYKWVRETRYKIPDNTLLVGFQAINHLISYYSFCGDYTFAKQRDAARCKEYFYLAAYCQEKLCHWPEEDPYRVTMDFVNFQRIIQFMMAVIADAEESLVRQLGEMLMLPAYNNWKKPSFRKHPEAVGNTAICLARGNDKKARRAAEQLLAYEEKRKALKSQKGRPLTWTCYARGALAVLDRDEAGLDDALRGYIRALRGNGKPVKDLAPHLMAHYAVFLGKIALRRGMRVTVDTLDCPRALMETVPVDYSYLELPRPQDGFPWERKPDEYTNGSNL